MTIKTITFQQTFPTGVYMNQKLGIEISITEDDYRANGDNEYDVVKEAYGYAKKYVNDAFKALNPELAPSLHDFNASQPEIVQVEKEVAIGDLETQIRSVTDKKVLDSYKLLVKGKPELEQLYLTKLEELS